MARDNMHSDLGAMEVWPGSHLDLLVLCIPFAVFRIEAEAARWVLGLPRMRATCVLTPRGIYPCIKVLGRTLAIWVTLCRCRQPGLLEVGLELDNRASSLQRDLWGLFLVDLPSLRARSYTVSKEDHI